MLYRMSGRAELLEHLVLRLQEAPSYRDNVFLCTVDTCPTGALL